MRGRFLLFVALIALATANQQVAAQAPAARVVTHAAPHLGPHIPQHIAPPGPPYLVLRQTAGAVAQPTVGQPYAYGWFGVAPRRHTITHRGYYGGHWLSPSRLPP